MWIRSQDKWLLTNVDTSNGIMINEYPDECLISLEYANTSFKLGEYSTKDKALRVLNDIQEWYECSYDETFQMPQDDDSNEEDDF